MSANSLGVHLINHHDPIRNSDREFVSTVLFRENDPPAAVVDEDANILNGEGDDGGAQPKLVKRIPCIQTLFYSWYLEELWNYQGHTSDERSFLKNTVSQLVLYMKRFLPATSFSLRNSLQSKSNNEELG